MAVGGCARIVDDGLPDGWVDRYRDAGVELGGSRDPVAAAEVVVVDGWRSGPDRPAWERRRSRVLVIDDHGQRGHYEADWVLDQNLGADPSAYVARSSGCRLLLGPAYALLRADVVAARPPHCPDRRTMPRSLLVASGGAPSPEVRAVFDAVLAHPEMTALGLDVVPLTGVVDVGAVLATVDMALSAAGSTTWELCAHGVPTILMPVVADQVPIAARVAEAGAALDIGPLASVDVAVIAGVLRDLCAEPGMRSAMAARGWGLVDGRGAERVVGVLVNDLEASARSKPG